MSKFLFNEDQKRLLEAAFGKPREPFVQYLPDGIDPNEAKPRYLPKQTGDWLAETRPAIIPFGTIKIIIEKEGKQTKENESML